MGLVVNLAESNFDVFADSAKAPTASAIGIGEIKCTMSVFGGKFSFAFKDGAGVHAPSTQPTMPWRIGVVQNVLYERMVFTFEHKTVKAEFVKPAVDSNARTAFPFIGESERANRADRTFSEVVPYRDLYYNTRGLGEILNPWEKFPKDLEPIAEKRRAYVQTVNWLDQPSFGCPLRPTNGGLLLELSQIVTFMVWLVAIDPLKRPGSPQVLAHVGPFSLVYSAKAQDPQRYTQTLSYPPYEYFAYGANGYVSHVSSGLQNTNPRIQIRAGAGARAPLLNGETANNRDVNWFVGHF
jgi:hypothetical protein